MFADPVKSILIIDKANAGVLQDHVLVTSYDGTMGVISLKEMEQYVLMVELTPETNVVVST
jgi:hypothetical protein